MSIRQADWSGDALWEHKVEPGGTAGEKLSMFGDVWGLLCVGADEAPDGPELC